MNTLEITTGEQAMVTIVLISLVCGALLGTRFTVTVLLPAFSMVVVMVGCIGLLKHIAAEQIVLQMIAALISLQLGYLVGLGGRYLIGRIRARRTLSDDLARSARRTQTH
jgi:hypothetical protein